MRRRLAHALLRPLLGPRSREVLEELEELHELDLRRRGKLGALLAYAAQVLAYPVRFAWAALREAPAGMGARLRDATGGALHDLAASARSLVRAPVHSAITIATLGLGIAAITVVFSLLNALRWAPMPFPDADRLVILRDVRTTPGRPPIEYTPSPRTMMTLRQVAPEFESLAGHRFASYRVRGTGNPTQTIGVRVTDGWLRTLGMRPELGRGFSPEEERAGDAARVALLGHDLWMRAFGGDASIVGRGIQLNGTDHTVVGIMPAGFRFPWGAQVWVPFEVQADDTLAGMGTVARLAAGIDGPRLRDALEAANSRADALYPETYGEIQISAMPLRDYLVDNRQDVAWVLLVAVVLLLLLGCANIAGLSTVRVIGRERELALRSAIGSDRGRLFRLLLLESALQAAGGGLAGVWLAWLLQDVFRSLTMASQSGIGLVGVQVQIDGRVLALATLAVGITALLAGALPAMRAMAAAGAGALLRARGAGEHPATGRLLSATVVAQAAAASALLVVAAAVSQAYLALDRADRGYATDDRLVVRAVLPADIFPDGLGRWQRLEALRARLREQPEVLAAGYTHHLPVTPGDWVRDYTFAADAGAMQQAGRTNLRWVSPGYFEAMGIELRAGRDLLSSDMEADRGVVVVTADIAARFGPGDRIVGQYLKFGALEDAGPWLQVVGITAPVQEEWGRGDTVYLPYSSQQLEWVEIVAHVRPGTSDLALASRLHALDPDQPVDDIRSLAELAVDELQADRLAALVIAGLALAGLGITILGTYGLVAYRVRLQRHELGVRMALGCSRAALLSFVLARGMRLVIAGILLGAIVALAIVLPAFLGGVLEGAEVQLLARGLEVDARGLALMLTVVLAVAAAACLVPALRAAAIDPARTLREQ